MNNKDGQNISIEKTSIAEAGLTLDEAYWNSQYNAHTTGWDLGEVSPPLKAYIDQLVNKNLRIFIPGCGNTYEAAYLLQQGFTNVTVIDIAPALVAQLQEKYKVNPHIKIILGDFFIHEGEYDLILEQTFFCALNPALRQDYIIKMHTLLAANGKLAGVLFNREFEQQGPPFGGRKDSYEPMFEKYFIFKTFEPCNNSFIKRKDTELFIILIKK
ncbi:MAG: methyltransferase domain-containing protein [Chitinophagaceae bacterium]|nr:methyltransferase domain-containing protein [Chitinophagaceae bacterium]